VLVLIEVIHPETLIDMRFFRSPTFSGAAIVLGLRLFLLDRRGGFLLLNHALTAGGGDVRGYFARTRAYVSAAAMAALMMIVMSF